MSSAATVGVFITLFRAIERAELGAVERGGVGHAVEERRVDVGGVHRVDGDPVRRELESQRARQPDDTVLGRGVVREPGETAHPRDRAGHDDAAGVLAVLRLARSSMCG